MKRLQRFTAACTLISAASIFAAVSASPRTNVQSAMSSPQREQQTQSSEIDELLRSAFDLYRKAGEPKKLVLYKKTTHYGIYNDYFEDVAANVIDWYDRHLKYHRVEVTEKH